MYGVALLIGFVAEFTLPIEHLWQHVSPWLGVVVVAVSVVIGCSAFNALIRSETAFDARKPTTLIVTHGAFRYSRKPTYLSLSLLYVGIALARFVLGLAYDSARRLDHSLRGSGPRRTLFGRKTW